MRAQSLNFNSIKVRLEHNLRKTLYSHSPAFQFHKGAIRTFLSAQTELCQLNFNSIKVRLELRWVITFTGDWLYFNSIKVRLEPRLHAISQKNMVKFQFHKGAIRTPS